MRAPRLRRNRRGAAAAALLPVLLLSACGSPATRYYTLAPVAGQAQDGMTGGPVIEVARVMMPDSLDRLSYVSQNGPDRLAISDRDRWSEPLDGMIRRVLAADLAALRPGLVLMPGDPVPPGPVRVLQVNIRQFAAERGGQVTLQADWSVLTGSPAKVLRRGRETITEQADSAKAADAVASMSAALGEFSRRIAPEL